MDVIGIDFGTTYSAVGVFRQTAEVVANRMGNRTTPSAVAFTDSAKPLVGEAAKSSKDGANSVFDAKRFIGLMYADVREEIEKHHYPFQVVDRDGRAAIEIRPKNETYAPEEIAAKILKNLKDTAEEALGREVHDAVLTVPASFTDSQRQAIKNAAQICKLNVRRLINEPTAAAIAYGLTQHEYDEHGKLVLVFDLGGGTFDITLMKIRESSIQVLATNGDNRLGGQDITTRLFNHFTTMEVSDRAKLRLLDNCEQAKRQLSTLENYAIDLGEHVPEVQLSRAEFERICKDLLQRPIDLVKTLLKDADIDPEMVHEVALVGGSTRIRFIETKLKELFPGKNLNRMINADEAVALGATIHGQTFTGRPSHLLLDISRYSLGITDKHGNMQVLIPRQTEIPAKKTEMYSTTDPDGVDIAVYEGEGKAVSSNVLLGTFRITPDPPVPVRTDVAVTFKVNADGVLQVTAQVSDQESVSVKIESKSLLSGEEVHRMAEDLENVNLRASHDGSEIPAETADDSRDKSPGSDDEIRNSPQDAAPDDSGNSADGTVRDATLNDDRNTAGGAPDTRVHGTRRPRKRRRAGVW